MKVRCIADGKNWTRRGKFIKKWPWSKKKPIKCDGPQYGDIVTVENEYYDDGDKYYCLVEWPGVGGYDAKWFVPVTGKKEEIKEVTFSEIKKEIPAILEN